MTSHIIVGTGIKVLIDGEEYELVWWGGQLTTRDGDFVGHYRFDAVRGGEAFPIREPEAEKCRISFCVLPRKHEGECREVP